MKKTLLILFLSGLYGVFNHAEAITGLTGSYKIGQVFLTWNKASDPSAFYKIYRSPNPITNGEQLTACEYLGKTDSKSAKDFNLSNQDGIDRYLHIDSGAAPLSSSKGLFVATTLADGDYYYAITVIFGSMEDITISSGSNTLIAPIAETVATPKPVFQEQRTQNSKSFDIYTFFYSSKLETNQPLSNGAGFMAFDFAVYQNTSPGLHPLRVTFHGGGVDFADVVTTVIQDEIVLSCEDRFPSNETSAWWGANENFDIYTSENNNTPPATGINYNYTLERITDIMDWVINHLPVDTNRIYMDGVSFGAPGAYFYTITYPERIAASKISVGVFNYSFQNDYQPNCSLNPGKKNRKSGDSRFGKVSTNLMTNMGYPIYSLLNGGWMIHNFNNKPYPVMYAISGKRDDLMGWSEKTIYYDSINANHIGGYYFWDNRDHGGNGQTWNIDNFNMFRYRRNLSFPAFSNCSLNEDYGTGDGSVGLEYGTVNGSLDWKNELEEDSSNWEAGIFIRDLVKLNGTFQVYPDSCTVDVTPRRVQHFEVPAGEEINWTVTHHNAVIQSGTVLYNGNCIIIPGVKIFRDTSILHLSYGQPLSTFYYDADGDDYGNGANPSQALTVPAGYVSDHTDCNDENAAIHPDAADLCNGIDDNCDGFTDENAITAEVSDPVQAIFCEPANILLTASSTGNNIQYQWMNNQVIIEGATNAAYTCDTTGNYSVTITNEVCTAVSNSTLITGHQQPVAIITPAGNITACKGNTITLTANIETGLMHQWFNNDVAIAGATNASYTVSKNVGGNFKATITNTDGCSAISNITTINRIAKPLAKITVIGDLDICTAALVTLEANGNTGYTYKWFKNSEKIVGEFNQTYFASAVGSYTVKVTENIAGCNKTSSPAIVYSSCKQTSESQELLAQEASIYPNPSTGDFYMTIISGQNESQGALEVMNILGETVFSEQLIVSGNSFDKQFHLPAGCTNGIYLVRLKVNDKNFNTMLSVVR